jgi:hypothetical protein
MSKKPNSLVKLTISGGDVSVCDGRRVKVAGGWAQARGGRELDMNVLARAALLRLTMAMVGTGAEAIVVVCGIFTRTRPSVEGAKGPFTPPVNRGQSEAAI